MPGKPRACEVCGRGDDVRAAGPESKERRPVLLCRGCREDDRRFNEACGPWPEPPQTPSPFIDHED